MPLSKTRKTVRRERRFVADEIRVDENKMEIEGYGAKFRVYSEDLGGFTERISEGAFKKTIKENDIRSLFNHDSNYVLARTKNKSLTLQEDGKGLFFNAKLPDTTYARDLVANIKAKNITQNSFGFKTVLDKWNKDMTKRELLEVRLFDVGPVTFPAYPQTTVSARSILDMYEISHRDLANVLVKSKRGIDLDQDEQGFLKSVISILSDILPTEPAPVSGHAKVQEDGPDERATQTRRRMLMVRLEMENII